MKGGDDCTVYIYTKNFVAKKITVFCTCAKYSVLTTHQKFIYFALQLEIIVDKGDIHYRNVRNSTYTYLIPDEAEVVGQFANTVSVSE